MRTKRKWLLYHLNFNLSCQILKITFSDQDKKHRHFQDCILVEVAMIEFLDPISQFILIDFEGVVAVIGQWDLADNIDRCYNDKEHNNDEMLHKIVATTKIGAL